MADARRCLVERGIAIAKAALNFHWALIPGPGRLLAIERAGLLWEEVSEQSALLEDLLIALQNKALAPLTGNKVPPRRPKESRFLRLTVAAGGELRLEDGEGNTLPPVGERLRNLAASWGGAVAPNVTAVTTSQASEM